MTVIMYVDFPHAGPFGEEMAKQMSGLAKSINNEPGMIWKIWTQNEADKTAGGVYLFNSRENAEKYLAMHSERLSQMGYSEIRGRIFEINELLSNINNGPFAQ
ncbi:Putative mono-oxygenase ydhR [Saccharicrinis carchari]|uniref:Mono-oxygenase ydhR n=1 Tax=Saccharicrinis carchari TaxID=1168039 RepID=A0A521AYQ4_SACCC|nr:monooxygenase [Saccharicrinis carchari]SMO39982.1 Putative mono-oxygenase ydhR [Saccharicrinis carchari]